MKSHTSEIAIDVKHHSGSLRTSAHAGKNCDISGMIVRRMKKSILRAPVSTSF
jgi:hypothetical protein